MDTLRGQFDALADSGHEPDEDLGRDLPPAGIGTDERRMQVRAYNHWASLLSDRNFPAIDDLEPAALPDFGPFSVLLDFSNGIDDPGIAFIGDKLATECDAAATDIETLADVPSRSLLSRITDHYMQILANQAPIGFEAEFVNQRGKTILYRGILLPFSSDDDTIDFIYGVINWKELADQRASDELLLEIDQALEATPARAPTIEPLETLTDWADGPVSVPANDIDYAPRAREDDLPRPSFGFGDMDEREVAYGDLGGPFQLADDADDSFDGEDDDESAGAEAHADDGFASLIPAEPQLGGALRKKPILLEGSVSGLELVDEPSPDELTPFPHDYAFDEPHDLVDLAPASIARGDMELGDWLAAAREMAAAARTSEDRTRGALYEAIGRAYDFSLAAVDAPEDFAELLSDGGLVVQDRAPMTPVVKLVFGAEYDKTRLTEYAAALTHAHRLQLGQGTLGEFLARAEGGLKGVVQAERRLRREEAGKPVESPDAPREAVARKLRELPAQDFAAIPREGREFALVMIRRTEDGSVVMLGEVPDDVALVEKAARRLIG